MVFAKWRDIVMNALRYFLLLLIMGMFIWGCGEKKTGDSALQRDESVPGQPTEIKLNAETTCFIYTDYIVRVTDGEIGQIIAVAQRVGESTVVEDPCTFSQSETIFSVDVSNDAGWFLGLEENYLLIDNGTSAGLRGLSVYHVEMGKQLLNTRYHAEYPVTYLSEGQLSYWEEIDGEGRECPRVEELKMDYGFEERVVYNLETGDIKRTGEIECSARQ